MAAAPIEVQVQARHLQQALKAGPGELYAAMRGAAVDVGKRFRAYHQKQRMRRKTTGVGIQSRSGRRGIASRFRVELSGGSINSLRLKVGARSGVAVQHEVGARLRPRGHVYMTLPMPAALDRSGRVKKGARRLLSRAKHVYQAKQAGVTLYHKGRKVRDKLIPVRRRRDGKWFLAIPRPKKSKAKPGEGPDLFMFHLVKSAQLRPTLQFRALWKQWHRSQGMKFWRDKVRYAMAAIRRKKAGGQ